MVGKGDVLRRARPGTVCPYPGAPCRAAGLVPTGAISAVTGMRGGYRIGYRLVKF